MVKFGGKACPKAWSYNFWNAMKANSTRSEGHFSTCMWIPSSNVPN